MDLNPHWTVVPRDDIYLQGESKKTGAAAVRYSDVADIVCKHRYKQLIRKRYPHLNSRAVAKARSFYNARYAPRRPRAALPVMRVLMDENLSNKFLLSAQKRFGYATSNFIENLVGKKDDFVWNHAVIKGYDFIISRDTRNRPPVKSANQPDDATPEHHLTYMALEAFAANGNSHKGLPILIHVDYASNRVRDFDRAMRNNLRDIFALKAADQLPTNVFRVNASGVHALRKVEKPKPETRGESLALTFAKAMLPDTHLRDRTSPEVMRIKKEVTRAVATTLKWRRFDPEAERLARRAERLVAMRAKRAAAAQQACFA